MLRHKYRNGTSILLPRQKYTSAVKSTNVYFCRQMYTSVSKSILMLANVNLCHFSRQNLNLIIMERDAFELAIQSGDGKVGHDHARLSNVLRGIIMH